MNEERGKIIRSVANSPRADHFRRDLLEWSEENIRDFPWRRQDATPYEVLIAEIFLKQTRSKTVGRVFPEFMDRFGAPEDLHEADRQEIIDVIRPLGLYNYRADALEEISRYLQDSSVPSEEDKLRELPQVGPYVANATLCFGFDEDRPVVDTNVERIYSRVFGDFGVRSFDEEEYWKLADEMLPEKRVQEYNLALLDLGALICKKSSPKCGVCFAESYCSHAFTGMRDGSRFPL